MESIELDRARIEAVIVAITERLDGAWLLVGGAAVALWLSPRRTTEDIDVMGLEGTGEERYRLMELAAELGLPIEVVNSAADFFVRRIAGWNTEMRVLRAGSRSVVHRPTTTLFVLLKLARLSARDLDDVRAAIAWAASHGEPLDVARVRAAMNALPASDDGELLARRAELAALLI